ncbi:MAG: hypothetical protein U5N85_07900 [Arcicella sp.]|nr:hypothetical protein [Arcicella sp.]
MRNAAVRSGTGGIALDGAGTGTALRGLATGFGYGLVVGGIFYIGTGGFQELVPDIPLTDVDSKTNDKKTITLFRGVNPSYMAQYILARQGVAIPRGGSASPREHSLGNTNSIFTSWSEDPNVAAWRAGSSGVILKTQMTFGDPRFFPNVYSKYPGEREYLIIGPVTGAKILKNLGIQEIGIQLK